jgi:hypothetical protein
VFSSSTSEIVDHYLHFGFYVSEGNFNREEVVVDGGPLMLFDDDYLGYGGSLSLNLRGSLPNFLNFVFIIFVVLFQGYTLLVGVLGFFFLTVVNSGAM